MACGSRSSTKSSSKIPTSTARCTERSAWGPDGKLRIKASFADGRYDGLVTWLEGGVPKQTTEFRAGKRHGWEREYLPDGTVRREREYRDGAMWNGEYDAPSQNFGVVRGKVVDGVRVGPWESKHKDGALEERGTYVDGARHGEFEIGDEKGNVWRGTFERGTRVGVWVQTRARGGVVRLDHATRAVTMTDAAGATFTFTVGEPADSLDRWLALVDWWSKHRSVSEDALRRWPDGERAEACRWVSERALEVMARPTDDGYPITADEDRDRSQLAAAAPGAMVLTGAADTATDDDDDDRWVPQRELKIVPIGSVELPRHVVVTSPDFFGRPTSPRSRRAPTSSWAWRRGTGCSCRRRSCAARARWSRPGVTGARRTTRTSA